MIYIPGSEPVIEACDEWVHVVEIEPQTFWTETQSASQRYRSNVGKLDWIRNLPKSKLLHGVGNPVGGSLSLDEEQFEAFRESIEVFRPPWVSEHLSFNRARDGAGVFATGFFLPPLQIPEVTGYCAANVRKLRAQVQLPVAFETGVNYIRRQNGEMSDGAFFRAVAEQADCGILLDLHNLWTNERNGRQGVLDVVSELPLDRVWELHLAGGEEINGCWLDAHSGLVPKPLMRITEQVIQSLPNLKAIIFEIMPQHIRAKNLDLRQIVDHLHWMHDLWSTRATDRKRLTAARTCAAVSLASDGDSVTGRTWENAVGRLAIGLEPASPLEYRLAVDRGIRVFQELITSIRGGSAQEVLPLTCCYLILSLGETQFRELFRGFGCSSLPSLFPSADAANFVRYLEKHAGEIPHLLEVAEFELASARVHAYDTTCSVHFTCDPERLMAALAAGHIPEELPAEEFEITVHS